MKFIFLILFLSSPRLPASPWPTSWTRSPFLTRFYTFFPLSSGHCPHQSSSGLIPPPVSKPWAGSTFPTCTIPSRSIYMALLTFLIFSGIIALNRLAPRFWCRYLCPLGALLSLISPLGFFKRRVSPECNECLKCVRSCPMGAIEKTRKKPVWPNASSAGRAPGSARRRRSPFPPSLFLGHQLGGEYSSVDFSRRGFLYSFAGGLAAAFLVDRTPFTPLWARQQIIRPPGAVPEAEFLRTCIRCGECMKSCVTNTLQPCFWESGLSGLWTSRMDLRLAACEQNCNVCGKVCPTQAIRSLSLEEKTHAKMGTAILRKERCLVWAQDKLCLICDEICPYNAIVFRTVDGYRRPVVIASRCNGCGFCEQRCPVGGPSAIVVVPDGEIRLKDGSYVKEAKGSSWNSNPTLATTSSRWKAPGSKWGKRSPGETHEACYSPGKTTGEKTGRVPVKQARGSRRSRKG